MLPFSRTEQCGPYVNRRFGGTQHLSLQGRISVEQETDVHQVSAYLTVYPEDGVGMFLRNFSSHTYYTALCPNLV
jgi:hypothetical protein